jgi:hypothetical protein
MAARLPSAATPRATPNSPLVSEIDAADPAFSGGAEPRIRFIVSAIAGEMPRPARVRPATTAATPPTSARVCASSPTPATSRPAAISCAGRIRRASAGASIEPPAIAMFCGTSHSPACSGDSPRTACKYKVDMSVTPAITMPVASIIASALRNERLANSRRSSSGLVSRRCRWTKAAPTSTPAATATAGAARTPSRAISLSP